VYGARIGQTAFHFCCNYLVCDGGPWRNCYCGTDGDDCLRWYHTETKDVPGNPKPLLFSDPQKGANDWRHGCYTSKNDTKRPYGYTAQYTVLRPTFKTLGAPDYYRKNYIKIFQVNCHSPIIGDEFYESENSFKGKIPINRFRFDTPKNKRSIWRSNEFADRDRNSLLGGAEKTQGQPYKRLMSKLRADPFPEIHTKYGEITTGDDFSEFHSLFTVLLH